MTTGKYKSRAILEYNVSRKYRAGKSPQVIARETGVRTPAVMKILKLQ